MKIIVQVVLMDCIYLIIHVFNSAQTNIMEIVNNQYVNNVLLNVILAIKHLIIALIVIEMEFLNINKFLIYHKIYIHVLQYVK
jgi:hypothetical protein